MGPCSSGPTFGRSTGHAALTGRWSNRTAASAGRGSASSPGWGNSMRPAGHQTGCPRQSGVVSADVVPRAAAALRRGRCLEGSRGELPGVRRAVAGAEVDQAAGAGRVSRKDPLRRTRERTVEHEGLGADHCPAVRAVRGEADNRQSAVCRFAVGSGGG